MPGVLITLLLFCVLNVSHEMKCSIVGCSNGKRKNPEKYFFSSPCAPGERRESWIRPTGKSISSNFLICEDHFDMDTDVEFFKINGAPTLYKSAYPHRNLTSPEMALQAKLDKINWKCFVPSCDNKRLMTDRHVVFFAVPEGLQGQFWRAAVFDDKHFRNDSTVGELEFCCEDHFDITNDLYKKFSIGTSIEYTIKAGVVPSLNLGDSKMGILDEVKVKRLADMNFHHRVILNNRLTYLYGPKFPLLIDRLQLTETVSFVAVKEEPLELDGTADIKTEPSDAGYEVNNKFVPRTEESCSDSNPLELETKHESETESESSYGSEEKNDPDVTTDDFSSDDDFEPDTDSSDDFPESESEGETESEDESDVDTSERFECRYCYQLVKNLDTHVDLVHWNFSKSVNRTRCGLCSELFTRRKDLRKHQHDVHSGNAYACDICFRLARTLAAIRVHILRTHSSERTLLCQHCGNNFKFIWELRRHERAVHIDGGRERTHACQLCDKKFFSPNDLRKHNNSVHLNLRPYKCDVDGCNKEFKQPFHLKCHHAQVHAKQNRYSCVICGKKFSLKFNLKAHLKNVHKN